MKTCTRCSTSPANTFEVPRPSRDQSLSPQITQRHTGVVFLPGPGQSLPERRGWAPPLRRATEPSRTLEIRLGVGNVASVFVAQPTVIVCRGEKRCQMQATVSFHESHHSCLHLLLLVVWAPHGLKETVQTTSAFVSASRHSTARSEFPG